MNKRQRKKRFNKLWDAHMATLAPREKMEFLVEYLNKIAGFPPGQGWVI